MKNVLILFSLIIIFPSVFAQNYKWAKSIDWSDGTRGNSVVTDASGNIYTTGGYSGQLVDFDPGSANFHLSSAAGFFEMNTFVQKLSPSGNLLWAKSFTGSINEGRGISLDASGNVYITGGFIGLVDFDPGIGLDTQRTTRQGVFITKLDANGNYIWAKTFVGDGYNYGYSIFVDGPGNVYTTGVFSATADFDPGTGIFAMTSIGNDDIFVSKLNSSGGFVWAKSFGGTLVDFGYSIAVDASGNVYTTGYFYQTIDFDPGVGVYNLTSAGNEEIFISKLNSSGNFVWAKSMGGTGSDKAFSLTLDASDNVYTVGSYKGPSDFDPGVAIFDLSGNGVFISKLDSAGKFIWAKSFIGGNVARSIQRDVSGNLYISGDFGGTADFDPGTGTFNLTTDGSFDAFLVKLNSAGNYVWAISIGGSGADIGNSIALDVSKNIYMIGKYFFTVDFDPSIAGTRNLTSISGHGEYFILKLDNLSTGIYEQSLNLEIEIKPNPAENIIQIETPNLLYNLTYRISDVAGRMVLNGKLNSPAMLIDISILPPGVYFVSVGELNSKHHKLIKK